MLLPVLLVRVMVLQGPPVQLVNRQSEWAEANSVHSCHGVCVRALCPVLPHCSLTALISSMVASYLACTLGLLSSALHTNCPRLTPVFTTELSLCCTTQSKSSLRTLQRLGLSLAEDAISPTTHSVMRQLRACSSGQGGGGGPDQCTQQHLALLEHMSTARLKP